MCCGAGGARGGFGDRDRDERPERRGGFGDRDRDDRSQASDDGPSRADTVDDWGATRKFTPSTASDRGGGYSDRGGFSDREPRRGGFGDRCFPHTYWQALMLPNYDAVSVSSIITSFVNVFVSYTAMEVFWGTCAVKRELLPKACLGLHAFDLLLAR